MRHMLTKLHVSSFLIGAAVGTVLVGSASVSTSLAATRSPVGAALPACIANGDYGAVLGEEQPNQTFSDDSRATRTDMWVPEDGANCQRVSSIYNRRNTFTDPGFEFGVFTGYFSYPGCTGYQSGFYERPTLFIFGFYEGGGSPACRIFNRTPTVGQYHLFSIADLDGNNHWGAFMDHDQITSDNGIVMDFNSGINAISMERGASNDGCYARFNNLEEWHAGNSWSLWDGLTNVATSPQDPDCTLTRINDFTGKISK